MKKLLLSLILLTPIVVNATNFGIVEPAWEDFAPSSFVDVKAPKGLLGKLNVTANYWYKRRVRFEEGLENCRSFETVEEQITCYDNLKVAQYKENSDYNARIEAQQNPYAGIPEMNNNMENMLQLNNYIDTFTRFQGNEIR